MIQANINDRYAQLSQQEKAELIGIYTRAGYRDLASIIAHYNSCGGKLHASGGPVTNTARYRDDSYLYNPPVNVGAPIETPLRYRPLPDYGDYQPQRTSGMIEEMPIDLNIEIPERGYGVLLPEQPATIPVLDARKDAARRIMAVENSKDNANGGYDARTGRWYPHKSHEGGADTIAYGIKLSNGTPEAKLALQQGYLTDEQAISAVDTLVQKYYNAAKKVYDGKYGAGEWDKLSDKSQSILVDYSYNPGLSKFPSLMEGFHSGNLDLIKKNYKRYSGGKPLGRNKTLLEEIEMLGNEYPIFRKNGGRLFEMGGPGKQNWFTRMMMNSVLNDPYTGAVATASGWTRDKDGNVTQTEENANSEGAKRLRTALAEIAAMPLSDLAVDIAGAAIVGTKTYKSIKLARELNKMLKAGEFDAAVDMAKEASRAEPIVKASTTLPAGYPSSSDYSLTRVSASLPATDQPVNLVSLPNYAGQVRDAIKAGKWGDLRFYRNIDGVPYTTDSGLIRLGKEENALVNITSDLPFRLHSNYKAAPGAEYLVIDPEAFIGKTPLSIEPMDTFFPNIGMDIDPKYVKIITGNKGIMPEIESKGMEVLTSPELQDLYSKIGGDFGSDAAAAYRDAVDKYITENVGRPSLADYAHLEEVTGLKSGTVPLSEQEVYNAAKQASKEIEDTYDWMSKMNLDASKYFHSLSDDIRWPYTHANGRDISAISFSEEPIIGAGGKVFYDTAPHIEAGLMESLGSYPHPDIDRLDSILEYTLDPSGYHYFDPQIGKQGFILPVPIKKDGGKIHIKPENRGKFTALKKRTGHSASWFKAHGTPAQKKMATFALNARKWKHEDGGPLREFDNISSLF